MRRGTKLWTGAILLTLGAIGWVVVRQLPVTHRFYTDADTIREPAAAARTRDILWQPVRTLSDVINTGADDYEPRLSADGTMLFFVRGKAGENADIYVSRHTHEGWSEPEPLLEVNSEYDDLGPEPSADGQSLFFYSDRPGGLGGYDLWVTHRSREGWLDPLNLGPAANSEFNDYGPALTPDGQTLYFASNRPGPQDADEPNPDAWPATLREDLYFRDYDLYMASVSARGVGAAKSLAPLNTHYNEGAPAVSSFADFLYFASDRPGGEGGFDLYRSRRLAGKHEPAVNLGRTINTGANELDAGLSLGGFALYFSSDRPSDERETHAPREYDLYHTTSREVFTDIERVERPPIDWAAWWSRIGPNLLWALLALLLLLALLALLRDARGRRLSLLAKCLLASLAAHLLLMLLFNAWEVTAGLARELRRRGPIQIALTSPAKGDDLASQMLGELTDVEAIAPPRIVSQRQSAPIEIKPATASMATLTVLRRPIELPNEPTPETYAGEAEPQRRTLPPKFHEPLSSTAVPMALEMNIPTEQVRTQTSEADSLAQMEPVEARALTRPAAAPVTDQAIDATARLAPALADRATLESQPDRASIADTPAPGDPEPSMSATTATPSTIATIDHPRVVDLALPPVAEERLAEVIEMPLEVATRVPTTPRRELPKATPQSLEAGLLRIEPASLGRQRRRVSFAESPTRTATDAIPASASPTSGRAREPAPVELPLPGLSLAPLESADLPATAESTPQRPGPTTDSVRRRLESATKVASTEEPLTPIEPIRIDVTDGDRSLAATPDRHATETIPVPIASETPAPRGLAAALPALTDFALPLLEQSSIPRAAESAPRVRPVAMESARASLGQNATTEVFASATPAFDVPPSWQHHADEEPDDLIDLPVRDSEVRPSDRAAPLSPPPIPKRHPRTALRLDLSLPTETRPPENPYLQRTSTDRMGIVERMGGSGETERAVADALRWLANHQSADGRWDGDGFDRHCNRCGGETDIVVDRALTGLALLSFLGAGHTHVTDSPYRENVERGLRWLVDRQKPDGDLRGDETMYTQGIATIALSEAYGMSGDATLAEPIRLATRFIDRARNQRVGGWRYDPGQVGDTSVLGWQIMAMKSASINGIAVPAGSFRAAREWLDLVSRPSNPGLYAYQPRRRPTPAMTAEGMFSQQLLGLRRDDPRMQASAAFISEHPPDWELQVNTYYWYYATLALFQYQGDLWHDWNETLTRQLVSHQRKDEPAAGSWDPVGEWADLGGRVYQTALCALMLEVYYRYLPLYSLEQGVDPIGSIRGFVTDASTGLVLPGATIRLDLPQRLPVSVASGPEGGYTLLAPEVPDHFALSASKEGYIPSSANVASAMVEGTTLSLDFELEPIGGGRIAVEPIPDVHHLGDNQFDGTINSQFQKESEGSSYAATFELQSHELGPHIGSAEVRLLAKGVQRSHKIKVNGTVLDQRLDDAPDDGSFGAFAAPFDPALLQEGTNTIEIIARPSSSDIDDFEFVNVQIHLSP